jgi:hypothetical protein
MFPAVICVLVVAAAAIGSALMVDHACTHSPPPLAADSPPMRGTSRASYCDTANTWLLLVLAPTALMAAASVILRRRPVILAAVAIVVSAALLGNVGVVNSLESALTV